MNTTIASGVQRVKGGPLSADPLIWAIFAFRNVGRAQNDATVIFLDEQNVSPYDTSAIEVSE